VYVGDTARFPYGPRPVDEIRRFALEIADWLLRRDVKMLVVACNSVEVSAIDDIAREAGVPVVGVIDPGVRAAIRATETGVIGLIGTEATVASRAYERAVAAAGVPVALHAAACPVFVEHVERGDTTSLALRKAARGYLVPLVDAGIDTLILGCTHYPLLTGLLQLELGPGVVLVSSAEETAKDVYAALVRDGLLHEPQAGEAIAPTHRFLCTGDPGSFGPVADVFLGPELAAVGVVRAEPVGGGTWN
jgi:glutamate racemase